MENTWGKTAYLGPRVDQKVWIYYKREVLEAVYLGHGNYYLQFAQRGVAFEGRWMPREIPAPPVE